MDRGIIVTDLAIPCMVYALWTADGNIGKQNAWRTDTAWVMFEIIQRKVIVDHGVLLQFFHNLKSSKKMQAETKGNGFHGSIDYTNFYIKSKIIFINIIIYVNRFLKHIQFWFWWIFSDRQNTDHIGRRMIKYNKPFKKTYTYQREKNKKWK